MGFNSSEYTRNDGYKRSNTYDLNEAGQATGISVHFTGDRDMGNSAWLYNGATTKNIGPIDNDHMSDDGYQDSTPEQLNDSGYVVGSADRFSGTRFLGFDAWLYDGTTTKIIGLTDGEHSNSDGVRWVDAIDMNAVGQVVGTSARFIGDLDFGRSAWLYNGSTPVQIGLIGPEHTRNDFPSQGYRDSKPYGVNEAGKVVGESERFDRGSFSLGRSIWLYDGTRTFDVGLAGSEHTRNDGYKSSTFRGWNTAEQVAGSARRYLGGSADMGLTAWFYDGATTIDIGLTDAEHTRSDGYQWSDPQGMNESGTLLGRSCRYNSGGFELGETVWYYDDASTRYRPQRASIYSREWLQVQFDGSFE